MTHFLSNILLYVYKIKKSNVLRILIKKVIGTNKIVLNFNNFKIAAGINSSIESNLIFNEYNELTILDIISHYCTKNYNFIDIGANIGIHSLTAAQANPNIEIFSFEPEPNNYLNFIKNIGYNNFLNIKPFKLGIGNFNGNLNLNINEGWNKGRHSLKVEFGQNCKKQVISVIKLDDLIENLNYNFLIIKIDVEGFEKEVIEGAKKVLDKPQNLVVIIELVTEINSIETCYNIIETFKNKGFEKIIKVNSNKNYSTVLKYEGSADYIFIKGKHAINNFINIS